ncbi:MAG: 50S ribosomal protein L19e, partial [Desulfurococcaceae archaeon]|nr:50S ribosomal protein L19e [Desulfurococcaceae archaeon]
MDLRYQRRLAAEVLGVGENNIIFDPEHLDRVANAVTREDIKKLVEEGIIKVENPR